MSDELINQADRYCKKHKYRLTQPRLEVLKIIDSSEKPIGAYQILEQLGTIFIKPKPPTVYRAIEFWQEHNFVHRIESLNAFVTCKAAHQHSGSQFMICVDCGIVIETHICHLPDPLKNHVDQISFIPSKWNLEIHGQCKDCS